jgi:hypothetical protein
MKDTGLTFDELIVLIFVLPMIIVWVYCLIYALWVFVDIQTKTEKFLSWVRRSKGE